MFAPLGPLASIVLGLTFAQVVPAVSDPLLDPPPAPARRVTSFDEALRALRAGSDDLAIAAARAQGAAARTRQALAPLLGNLQGTLAAHYDLLHPDVAPASFAGGAAGARHTPTVPLGVGQIAFQIPLVDLSLWQARAAARAAEQAERAGYGDSQRRLVGGLGSTLIDVMAAERAAELQREGLRQALERQFLVQRTVDLGTGTRLDLVRAQQDTRLARADVLVGRERVIQVREALGALVGEARPVGVDPALDAERFLDGAGRVCRRVPAPERPDVVAARLRLRAAEEAVDEAWADYAPALQLQSATAAYTVEPGPLRVPAWTVSALLSVPLWDGGGRGARLDERRWAARAADRELRLVGRDVGFEQARSNRGVTVARDVLTEASAARDLARDADRMTRRSFEAGASTSFELVQSAQALRQAELVLAARQFDLAGARFGALIAEAACDIQ